MIKDYNKIVKELGDEFDLDSVSCAISRGLLDVTSKGKKVGIVITLLDEDYFCLYDELEKYCEVKK